MKAQATLKDIARETGVHVSTVSRALDPNFRHLLTSEVVGRVTAAADALDYRPNRIALGLRTKRSMTVGIIIPDIANSMFPPIVRGIECVLEPLGYASIIVNTDNAPERENRLVDVLSERGVDGIVHAASLRSDEKLSRIESSGVPVVALNRSTGISSIPEIVHDESYGIELAMRHLHDFGHRRIAFISGPPTLSTGLTRLESFKLNCDRLRIPAESPMIIIAERFDESEGKRCAEELCRSGHPFSAVLCANDLLALGAIGALKKHGLHCPDDVSVTGFNDMPALEFASPRLTTIRVRKFEAGRRAAEILASRMEDPNKPVPDRTVLPIKLIVRSSVSRAR